MAFSLCDRDSAVYKLKERVLALSSGRVELHIDPSTGERHYWDNEAEVFISEGDYRLIAGKNRRKGTSSRA